MLRPVHLRHWMSESDLNVFVEAFTASGMRGPFNRYRAQGIDAADLGTIPDKVVTAPAFFLAGAKDAVRAFFPGVDLYADAGAFCKDFRRTVIVPDIGHWVQQAAPADTNETLEGFLNGL